MKPLGIRGQLILILVVVLSLVIIATAVFIRDLVYENIIKQKLTTAEVLTSSLVHDIKYEYNFREEVAVDTIISKYVTYYRIIDDVKYYAVDDSLVVILDNTDVRVYTPDHAFYDAALVGAIEKAKPVIDIEEVGLNDLRIRSIAPVLQGSEVMGAIVLDISVNDVNVLLNDITQRILIVLAVTSLMSAVMLYVLLNTTLLSRLARLIRTTQQISLGDYSTKINDTRNDEVGQLSNALDLMMMDLQKSKQRIDDHNKIMAQKVKDATAELTKTYEDLKNAQGQIVLSEKMASLGVLIAGVAHEINTPVGAINNVSRRLEVKVRLLPTLFKGFENESIPSLSKVGEMLEKVIDCSFEMNRIASFKEVRAVEALLQQHQVESWRDKADILTTLNFTDSEHIAEYIDCIRSESIFGILQVTGYIAHAAKISETSSLKIQDIIKALKFYAYTDKDKIEATQINESINTSLVLMNSRLKHSISIYKTFDENLPVIPCNSEIHQIWTILLNNAVDAIEAMGEEYNGVISIQTSLEGESVIVRIKDNGGGIPEEVKKKIFDPFFTTKDIGKGTGLGLSIVTGIISKHGGAISVEADGDETTFVVSISVQGIQPVNGVH